jgi:small conductance mechanosensitive channel
MSSKRFVANRNLRSPLIAGALNLGGPVDLIPNAVHIFELTIDTRGPVPARRTSARTDHYWQVYFDINRAMVDTFRADGYPVPEEHVHMRHAA